MQIALEMLLLLLSIGAMRVTTQMGVIKYVCAVCTVHLTLVKLRVFAIHFAGVGIHISKGHEVHVADSFLGEYEWGEAGSGTTSSAISQKTAAPSTESSRHLLTA